MYKTINQSQCDISKTTLDSPMMMMIKLPSQEPININNFSSGQSSGWLTSYPGSHNLTGKVKAVCATYSTHTDHIGRCCCWYSTNCIPAVTQGNYVFGRGGDWVSCSCHRVTMSKKIVATTIVVYLAPSVNHSTLVVGCIVFQKCKHFLNVLFLISYLWLWWLLWQTRVGVDWLHQWK